MSDEKQNEHQVCYRCLVAGDVQGVFYRASTRHEAQQLGITGYARNLPDGRVEVVACGTAEAVTRLTDWLHEGPSGARVSGVACEVIEMQVYSNFVIA
jgi:acylphosphatase